MLPVPAPMSLSLLSPHSLSSSSSLLHFLSPAPNNSLPARANIIDGNTSKATMTGGRKLEINEQAATESFVRKVLDMSGMDSRTSEVTDNVFSHQQQQQQPIQGSAADKVAVAIARKGLNWTELVIESGEDGKGAERIIAKAKSAKEKEDGGRRRRRRRDHRSGRWRRIPLELDAYSVAVSTFTKANTSQPSNQSRSILVSRNPITNNTTGSGSSITIDATAISSAGRSSRFATSTTTNTTATRFSATNFGRMPIPTSTTTTTISAQSVPTTAGFIFYTAPRNGDVAGIRRYHHKSKHLVKKELFLRSTPIEQHHHQEEQQSRSRQRHHHHYHYRDVFLQSPQHLDTAVLPPSSLPAHKVDNDGVNDDYDYGDDDRGISNFPTAFQAQVRRNVADYPNGNKNTGNNIGNIKARSETKLVQTFSSSKHASRNSSSSSSSIVSGKKEVRKRHLLAGTRYPVV